MGKVFSIDNSHIKHDKHFNNNYNIKQQSDNSSASPEESSSYHTTPASSPLAATDNSSNKNSVNIQNDNELCSFTPKQQLLPEFHITQPSISTDDSPVPRSLSEGLIKLRTESASPHIHNQSAMRISQSTSDLPFIRSIKRQNRRGKHSLTLSGISGTSNSSASNIAPQQQEQHGQQRHQHQKKMSGISSLKSALSSIYSNSDDADSETNSNSIRKENSKKNKNKKIFDIHHTTSDYTLSSTSPELIAPSRIENHSTDLSLGSVSTDNSSITKISMDDYLVTNSLGASDDQRSVHSDISALCQV